RALRGGARGCGSDGELRDELRLDARACGIGEPRTLAWDPSFARLPGQFFGRLDQTGHVLLENVFLLAHRASEKCADSVAKVSRNARGARARRDLVASTEIPSSPASVSRLSPSTYLRVSALRYCSGRFAMAMCTRSRVSARSSTSPGSGRSAI